MREFDWQCFITAYYEGHRAGHNLWPIWEDFASDPPEDAMLDVYREIDAQIGRLLGALDLSNTALVLFSMHGMTAGYGQDHFLPEIMQRINRLYLGKLGHHVEPRRPGLARVLRQTVPGSVQLHIRRVRWPDGSGLAGRSRMEGRQRLEDDSGVSGPNRRRCRLHQIERPGARAAGLSSRGGRRKLVAIWSSFAGS